jgi:hypothetical protein
MMQENRVMGVFHSEDTMPPAPNQSAAGEAPRDAAVRELLEETRVWGSAAARVPVCVVALSVGLGVVLLEALHQPRRCVRCG